PNASSRPPWDAPSWRTATSTDTVGVTLPTLLRWPTPARRWIRCSFLSGSPRRLPWPGRRIGLVSCSPSAERRAFASRRRYPLIFPVGLQREIGWWPATRLVAFLGQRETDDRGS